MKLAYILAALLVGPSATWAVVQTKEIRYQQGQTTLIGVLAWDDSLHADARIPGVIVVPEWWGLTDYAKGRARQLAELGYVALAADMYGDGVTTADPKEAGKLAGAVKSDRQLMRARVAAALEVLRNQPNVDPHKLAAIGYCFGGTTVLELAMSSADVRGVVSFHGGLEFPTLDDVKSIKARVMICNGAADHFISAEQIGALTRAMSQRGVVWSFINYPDAVHSFTNPHAGRAGIAGVAYNEQADRQSWMDMRAFFTEIFR